MQNAHLVHSHVSAARVQSIATRFVPYASGFRATSSILLIWLSHMGCRDGDWSKLPDDKVIQAFRGSSPGSVGMMKGDWTDIVYQTQRQAASAEEQYTKLASLVCYGFDLPSRPAAAGDTRGVEIRLMHYMHYG